MFTTPLTPAADLGDFAYNFRHGRKEIKWRRGSGKSYASCSRFLEIISISRDAVMPIKSPNSPARQSIFNPPRDTGLRDRIGFSTILIGSVASTVVMRESWYFLEVYIRFLQRRFFALQARDLCLHPK